MMKKESTYHGTLRKIALSIVLIMGLLGSQTMKGMPQEPITVQFNDGESYTGRLAECLANFSSDITQMKVTAREFTPEDWETMKKEWQYDEYFKPRDGRLENLEEVEFSEDVVVTDVPSSEGDYPTSGI